MLDFFSIFSKGGIVLWYFQGTSQLFTQPINALIKSVILQVRHLCDGKGIAYHVTYGVKISRCSKSGPGVIKLHVARKS